jgi:hypothetical protein
MAVANRFDLGGHTRKHGMSNSRITGYANRAYGIWQAMRDRCSNSNRRDYHCYGGKGVKVCERWQSSFENFLADMGEPPPKYTLERINKDGNYEPGNCEWADRKTQASNTSRNRTIVVNGVRRLAKDVAQENGINPHTYKHRLYFYRWTLEQACGLEPRK